MEKTPFQGEAVVPKRKQMEFVIYQLNSDSKIILFRLFKLHYSYTYQFFRREAHFLIVFLVRIRNQIFLISMANINIAKVFSSFTLESSWFWIFWQYFLIIFFLKGTTFIRMYTSCFNNLFTEYFIKGVIPLCFTSFKVKIVVIS